MSIATAVERELADLLNAERTARGLQPLQLETHLNLAAERHSRWMLDTDTLSHTGIDGTSHFQRMERSGFDLAPGYKTGENISAVMVGGATGYSDEVRLMHEGLMNSAGHRANILRPEYEYLGIGIEFGTYGGTPSIAATQLFGATVGSVSLDGGGGGPAPDAAPASAPATGPLNLVGTMDTDVLTGQSASDVLKGLGAADVLKGGGGNDAIVGGGGNDAALGGTGDDNIRGGGGEDRLLGNAGNDLIQGQVAGDLLNGGGGDDVLVGGGGQDVLIGGGDDDRLLGGGNNDVLHGGPGNDFLNGGPGSDELFGGGGDDVLVGGGGRDALDGGGGDDLMLGGGGADTFRFNRYYGDDAIIGFEGMDRIELGTQLWAGNTYSALEVVETFGSLTSGGILLDFGSDTLQVNGAGSFAALADTLVFI